MVVQVDKLLRNIIAKQAKIAHVPCDFLVFKTADIPENIHSKIVEQYSEDFLGDAQFVVFCKGPIDKDMREKIFKCVDKALGGDKDKKKNANLLNVADFKLLKMHDDEEDFPEASDAEEPDIDAEVNSIVDEPDEDSVDAAEEPSSEDAEADNEETVGDALSQDSQEATDDSEQTLDDEEPEDTQETSDDTEEEDDDSSDNDEDDSEEVKESINEDDSDEEDQSQEQVPAVPTRYVFLKISLKK